MKLRFGTFFLLFVASAAMSASAWAQVPAGAEFQVNTYTTADQQASSVASDRFGNFVVVWTSDTQDGSGLGVFARRFDAAGAPQGPEFRVNSLTGGDQFSGAVAMDNGGNFVVAWTSDGQDGGDTGIFARRFRADGQPDGTEFQVNTYTTGMQAGVGIAFDPMRGFVVAWAGAGPGDASGVFARRYDPSGSPRGTEFRLNEVTTGEPFWPAPAFDASGRLIVAWSRHWYGVSARRYDAAGAPLGAEFRVDTPDPMNLTFTRPGVAADAAGNFVVVWSRRDYWPPIAPPAARGPGESGVFGQRYDAAGTPQGTQFTVFSSSLSAHNVTLASDSSGQFIVVWDVLYGPNVRGSRYDASGAPRGGPFVVSATTGAMQFGPFLAADPAGNFVAVWTLDGRDGDRYGVVGRRFGGILPAAAAVDSAPGGGSDGNGVLEPGESVDVKPSWRNVNGATQTFDGAGLGFTGPAATGVSYQLLDDVGTYGAIANGATAQCVDCYRVGVTFSGTRPSVHWDATFTERLIPDVLGQTKPWPLHLGQSFPDVPKTSLFYRDVETLLHRGITGGCTATQYCPANPVTRDQMAAFVLPAKEGAGYRPQPCSPPNTFADVPETSLFCDVIEELARRGVVSGCGGGNYCPAAAVTREQMPVFVLRLLDPTLDPPACTTPMFADVPASNPFCRWIEELARRGVVAGCGGGNYCPAAPVTREQMGAFITGTYGLTLYGP